MHTRFRILLGFMLLTLTLHYEVTNAWPEDYPARLVRVLVPSAAGTPPDIVVRIVFNQVARTEGWQVVIENKPGAMQTIGIAEALRHPADGYTVLAVAQSSAVAPALMTNISFRLRADLAPVIHLINATHVLVVHPSVKANSVPELVSAIKTDPTKFSFSSGGFGTPAHLAGELFNLEMGERVTHVPYRALPQAMGDLLNGTIQYQFITPLPALDLIEAGKLRALAATGTERIAALNSVPTVVEQGFPNLVIQDWIGLMVKSGTPVKAVERLNMAINRAIRHENVRGALLKISAQPIGGRADEFGGFVDEQLRYWAAVVKKAGIKLP